MSHLTRCRGGGIWLPVDLSCLVEIRQYLLEVAAGYHGDCMSDELQVEISEIQLATTELVSNVIRHGFPQQSGTASKSSEHTKLHLCAFVNNEGMFVVQVTHSGKPFDGNKTEIMEVTSPMEGQMGLFIISRCVDHVYYASTDSEENYIWLFRNLSSTLQHSEPGNA